MSDGCLIGFYLTCPNHSEASCVSCSQTAMPLLRLFRPQTLDLDLISLFFFHAVFNSSVNSSASSQTNFRI